MINLHSEVYLALSKAVRDWEFLNIRIEMLHCEIHTWWGIQVTITT